MIDSDFRLHILTSGVTSESAIKFLASADVVPVAKNLLNDAPNLIPISRIIGDSWHYAELFGDRFAELFGKEILSETRKVLITRDGYKVNPVLSALRRCGIWSTANSLAAVEKEAFAGELIMSLNSNNFETINLLSFNNRVDIPTQWVKLLLDQWLNNLKSTSWTQDRLPYYWENYLGLLERYTTEIGHYSEQTEILGILISSVSTSSHSLNSISNLASNAELWKFWRSILVDNQPLIQSSPFEAMT